PWAIIKRASSSYCFPYFLNTSIIDRKRLRSSPLLAFFTHFVVFRYLPISTLPASEPAWWVLTNASTASASFGLFLRKAHAIETGGLAMPSCFFRLGNTCR